MKILFVTPNNIDLTYGGSIRSSCIRAALQKLGDVDTVVFQMAHVEHRDGEWQPGRIRKATYTRPPGPSGEARAQRSRLKRWLAQLLDEGHYDLHVVCFASTAWLLPRSRWRTLVVDLDDAFRHPGPGVRESLPARLKRAIRAIATQVVARGAAHVGYVHPLDGPRLATQRKTLLRNVVPFPDPRRERPAPVPGRLLMVGLLEHAPNALGLRWFVDEVLPQVRERVPGAELHVVGSHGWQFAQLFGPSDGVPGLRLRGFVDDLSQEYARASVVVAPIFTGGGTQIKVIDALAHERPLIASPFAHGGFAADLTASRDLLVPGDRRSWVESCVRILENPALGAEMAARGHEAAAVYDAGTMTATIATMVRQALGEGNLQVRK